MIGSCRSRGQGGFTLIEMLLVVTMTGVVMVPLLGWTVMAMRANEHVRNASDRINGRNLLGAHLSQDVAQATAIDRAGADCLGGDHAGGTVLFTLTRAPGSQPAVRFAYTVAPEASGVTSVWRRTCAADGTGVSETELLRGVVQPAAGWTAAVACSPRWALDTDACGQLTVTVPTKNGPGVNAIATRRIEGPR